MKFGPVRKIDKRNTMTSKIQCDGGVMLANYDVIDIFPIYGRFGLMVYNKNFINNSLLSNKS